MTPTSLSAYSTLQAKCDVLGTKLVLPEAMTHQRFMLIGEALGETEHDTGRYFVGKISWILWKLTGDVGLLRDVIHVSNVVKVRPPDNKLLRLQELGLSIDDFIPYLEEEISVVRPDAILAVGSLAARTLCPQVDSVLKHRGTIHTYTDTNGRAIPVIITLHPSYLHRGNMQLYPFVRNDVKIFANTGFGITAPTTTSFTTHLNPTFNQAYEFLSAVNQAPATSYDIETVGRQKITCIGYTLTPDEAMCIPFRIQGLANRWSEAEQILLIRKMQDIHHNPTIVKIGQNVSYDNHYLLPLLGFPREPLIDTMFAHWLLHPDAPHDLGFIMSLYTDMPYHKDDAKNWELKSIPHTEALWQYNATDCIGTHRCWLGLASDLKDLGMYEFFVGYIMPVRRVLFEMEARGLRINTDLMAEWRDFVETDELPCWLERVNKYFPGRTVNPNSSKQLGEALTELYKLPIKRTAKGNFTLDNDRIVELKVQFPAYRNMLDDVHCARTIKSKDLGTYLDPKKLSPDGRMRTSFGTTITGRQSSKANGKGEGQNLQNQPKKFRVMFLPEPGQVFVEPDLVGAEAFVMVCMMKLDDIKQRMLNGEKIHNIVGEWIYEKPKERLTPEEYLQAKRCVHGSNYRLGINKFAILIERPVAFAKILRSKYNAIMPQLSAYHSEIERRIRDERRIVTPYGRVRTFTGLPDDETYRSGYAQIPQSTVVDTLNMGMLGLWLIKPDNIYLALQVHDSILISLPPSLVDWFTPYIKAHMETLRKLDIEGVELTIPVDIGRTKANWYGEEV